MSDDSWQEMQITGDNEPGPVGEALATWQPSAASFVEVDITSAVQQQTDGKLSLFIDCGTGVKHSVTFASREAADNTQHPALVVTTQ